MRSAAVFIGGALGTLARWAVALAVPAGASFPLATLIVNVSGAFGLGLAGVLLAERLPPRPGLRSFAAMGFFGAYTTFSTMAMEGVRLIESGRLLAAALYWVLTLVLGQMAGVYGMWAGRIERPKREEA
ncbi:MAG: fluoride efflux transporter CrcB [Actinomycetota bacterium]